jgi:hypothetical protein
MRRFPLKSTIGTIQLSTTNLKASHSGMPSFEHNRGFENNGIIDGLKKKKCYI